MSHIIHISPPKVSHCIESGSWVIGNEKKLQLPITNWQKTDYDSFGCGICDIMSAKTDTSLG